MLLDVNCIVKECCSNEGARRMGLDGSNVISDGNPTVYKKLKEDQRLPAEEANDYIRIRLPLKGVRRYGALGRRVYLVQHANPPALAPSIGHCGHPPDRPTVSRRREPFLYRIRGIEFGSSGSTP